MVLTVGVLALQGGFYEHLSLLKRAAAHLRDTRPAIWQDKELSFIEVRNPRDLSHCDALIIPGGESTTIALAAADCGLLEPLRQFVKVDRKPTWGTCAGLVLLSEEATATKKGGQELIGGLDVRVQRNHFGRQVQSFIADVDLPFLESIGESRAYPGVFIRAPVVEKLLTSDPPGSKTGEAGGTTAAEVLAVFPQKTQDGATDRIVAVRQGNVLGTSFHPELTDDIRMHVWWLDQAFTPIFQQQNA